MKQHWSGKSIGGKWQYALFDRAIRLGSWPMAYCMLFFVVTWYCLLPSVAHKSTPYLQRRFPAATPSQLLQHRWRLHWMFGRVLADKMVCKVTGTMRKSISAKDRSTLEALLASGKGMIIVSAHVGCWQSAMREMQNELQHPVTVVLHMARGDFDAVQDDFEGLKAFATIDPTLGTASALAMLQCLQRGEILVMMGDRVRGSSHATVQVPFLKGTVAMPWGAYYLASASGAPVVTCFTLRTAPCTMQHVLARVTHVPAGLRKNEENYRIYLEQFSQDMEHILSLEPYQFFNFYNMWDA